MEPANSRAHQRITRKRDRCPLPEYFTPIGVRIVRGWPTMYIIDHQGVIRHKSVGSPGGETLDEWINALVDEAEADLQE